MISRRWSVAVVAVLAVSAPAVAQPRISNGRVTEQPVTRTLSETVNRLVAAATEPMWIAYAAPVEDGSSSMCCWSTGIEGRGSDCCGSCRLEPGSGTTFRNNDQTNLATRLEPRDTFFVFYRVETRRIERVRMFSEDCAIDAGGRQVQWLTGVKPAESLALLSTLAQDQTASDRGMKGAIAAIAQHAGNDAITPLVRLGREAPSTKVRSEALFWLAQRAGARATAAITEAIEHDPETQVKKQAVFALSQLPAGEGVPKLIELAKGHANPVVRKQAMFWLGQSRDPRALSFFEQILKQ